MGAEGIFNCFAVHFFRACPALRRAQNNHRPNVIFRTVSSAHSILDSFDIAIGQLQRFRHRLMHTAGFRAFHKVRLPAHTCKKLPQHVIRSTGQNGRIGNLVAVQMQNRQHRAIFVRIDKFVALPGSGQRTSFRFSIADHAGRNQIGIVKYRAKGMGQRIAQFSALMNRAGHLRRHMTGNPAGKGKLLE